MQVNISNHKATVIENGIFYFAPSNYPEITALELKNILSFIDYEKSYGRKTDIICENEVLLTKVNNAIAAPEIVGNTELPVKIAGCPDCFSKGCLTEFVYHATTLKSTKKILQSGKLLSAVKVYGKSGEELASQKRDSLWNDPADFFEYIMFTWGNCVVGDCVVMSDSPGGGQGEFNPGVRFYFRYADIIKHHGHVFDGYHPVKVNNEIVLSDYLLACIVPEQFKDELLPFIPSHLKSKVHFISQDGLGIWDWSERVYNCICTLNNGV